MGKKKSVTAMLMLVASFNAYANYNNQSNPTHQASSTDSKNKYLFNLSANTKTLSPQINKTDFTIDVIMSGCSKYDFFATAVRVTFKIPKGISKELEKRISDSINTAFQQTWHKYINGDLDSDNSTNIHPFSKPITSLFISLMNKHNINFESINLDFAPNEIGIKDAGECGYGGVTDLAHNEINKQQPQI